MPNNAAKSPLSRIAIPDLVKAARSIPGFKLTRVEFASVANLSGVRTKRFTFTRRLDSRTIFASDSEYGYLRTAGTWTSSDRPALAACRRALRNAKIPAAEISVIHIQREMGQTAERVDEGKFRTSEPRLLRKLAVARRIVCGVPVWSSYAAIGLTAKGTIGSLEIHWPELPEVVVNEAILLQQLVKRGFRPPEVKGGRPESVEAGVIHSTAVGFFMDISAVVRVIYAVTERNVGRKPVLYLDRHSNHVEPTRSVRPTDPKAFDRPQPLPPGH